MSTFGERGDYRKSTLFGGPDDDRPVYLEPDQLEWIEQWAAEHGGEGQGPEIIQDLLDHITILEGYIKTFLAKDEPLH